MFVRKFYNRDEEMRSLEQMMERKGPKLIPVYGKRRIGKTSLIKELIRRNGGIYYLCSTGVREKNIEKLNSRISEALHIPKFANSDYIGTFKDLLRSGFKDGIIAIDEFPYILLKDEDVLSEFQIIIDEILADTNITLILCGSSISMMEEKVLSGTSPLFGRRTGQIRLGPIPPGEIGRFLPGRSPEELLEIDSIIGRIPRYLIEFHEMGSIEKTLKRSFFSPDGYLYREAYLLLRDELREPDTYSTILEALAGGRTKMTEIGNASFIPAKDMPKYLGVLERLGIVEKEHPVTDNRPMSKMTRYRMKDNLFRFHFRFVMPEMGSIELNEPDGPYQKWIEEKSHHISTFVEDLVARYAVKDLDYEKAGRWWFRGDEIDCVAYDRKKNRALFSEIKWKKERTGPETVEILLQRSLMVKELQRMKKEYLIVSKGGFTKKAMEIMEESGIEYLNGSDLASKIYGSSPIE